MATIRKKGDGWHVQIRRKGHQAVTKTFTIKSDAQRWALLVESEMERGIFVDRTEAEATSLSEALDSYRSEVSIHKKTYSKEKSIIKQWQNNPLAKRSLASIRQVDVVSYRDMRLKKVGAASVRNELALLSHLFTIAIKEWGFGLTNPVLLVRKPAPVRARDRRLSDEEIARIIECTESVELPAIIRLLTETAMRRGELGKLRWEQIDLTQRIAVLQDTKNGEDRVIPLSSRAVSTLQSLPPQNDGAVISMTNDAITRAFKRACSRAGVKNARIHDLRHEAVSRLFGKGLDAFEVAAISGHKTMDMLKRYTHLKATELVEKLG